MISSLVNYYMMNGGMPNESVIIDPRFKIRPSGSALNFHQLLLILKQSYKVSPADIQSMLMSKITGAQLPKKSIAQSQIESQMQAQSEPDVMAQQQYSFIQIPEDEIEFWGYTLDEDPLEEYPSAEEVHTIHDDILEHFIKFQEGFHYMSGPALIYLSDSELNRLPSMSEEQLEQLADWYWVDYATRRSLGKTLATLRNEVADGLKGNSRWVNRLKKMSQISRGMIAYFDKYGELPEPTDYADGGRRIRRKGKVREFFPYQQWSHLFTAIEQLYGSERAANQEARHELMHRAIIQQYGPAPLVNRQGSSNYGSFNTGLKVVREQKHQKRHKTKYISRHMKRHGTMHGYNPSEIGTMTLWIEGNDRNDVAGHDARMFVLEEMRRRGMSLTSGDLSLRNAHPSRREADKWIAIWDQF